MCRYLGLATQLAQFTVRYHRTLARLKQTFPKLPAKLRTPLQTALNDAAHTLHAASLSFPKTMPTDNPSELARIGSLVRDSSFTVLMFEHTCVALALWGGYVSVCVSSRLTKLLCCSRYKRALREHSEPSDSPTSSRQSNDSSLAVDTTPAPASSVAGSAGTSGTTTPSRKMSVYSGSVPASPTHGNHTSNDQPKQATTDGGVSSNVADSRARRASGLKTSSSPAMVGVAHASPAPRGIQKARSLAIGELSKMLDAEGSVVVATAANPPSVAGDAAASSIAGGASPSNVSTASGVHDDALVDPEAAHAELEVAAGRGGIGKPGVVPGTRRPLIRAVSSGSVLDEKSRHRPASRVRLLVVPAASPTSATNDSGTGTSPQPHVQPTSGKRNDTDSQLRPERHSTSVDDPDAWF